MHKDRNPQMLKITGTIILLSKHLHIRNRSFDKSNQPCALDPI